jgi:hypothetical protein
MNEDLQRGLGRALSAGHTTGGSNEPGVTLDKELESFRAQFLVLGGIVKATQEVVEETREEMRTLRMEMQDSREEYRNYRAIQRNGHSRKKTHRVHKITKKDRGFWTCHESFPRTVGEFRRLGSKYLMFSLLLRRLLTLVRR